MGGIRNLESVTQQLSGSFSKVQFPFFFWILDLIRSGISPIIALRDVRIVGNNGMQYLPSLQFVIETNTE